MPAATCKTDLLKVTQFEFERLQQTIATLTEPAALRKLEDAISIKDVIGHRAHWIGLFLGWLRDGKAGRPVHIPDARYKWNQLDQLNAEIRESQADLGWVEACRLLQDRHSMLVGLIGSASEADLYDGPMPGHANWTTGRFAEASGASHYRSARKYIRAALRRVQSAKPPGRVISLSRNRSKASR